MGRAVLTGLLLGTLAMAAFLTLVLSLGRGDGDGFGVADLIGTLILSVVMGGAPGTLIGLVVGSLNRPRRRAVVEPPPPPPLPPVMNDRWSAIVSRCRLSVNRVRSAVATVPPSPARAWMERIVDQFAAELANVSRLADLGRALNADGAHPVSERLRVAVRDFTAFEAEVGRVAVRMFDQPSLDNARVHLELLEQQLPHLGEVRP